MYIATRNTKCMTLRKTINWKAFKSKWSTGMHGSLDTSNRHDRYYHILSNYQPPMDGNNRNKIQSNKEQFKLVRHVQNRHLSQSFYESYLSLQFPPIGYAHSVLDTVHSTLGLPWWATIALTTALLRTFITLPLTVLAFRNNAKRQLQLPEITALGKELALEVACAAKEKNWDERHAKFNFRKNMKRLVSELHVRDNCHPLKEYILPWIQIPLWISTSFALRNMSGTFVIKGLDLPVLSPDMSTEGTLWFTNLLIPNPVVLPIALCLINLVIIEMHNIRMPKQTGMQKGLTYVFRGLALIMLPVASSVPSCMSLYWTCSSIYGLAQNILLMFLKSRRLLGIPKTPSESETPFQDLWKAITNKLSRKKNQEQK